MHTSLRLGRSALWKASGFSAVLSLFIQKAPPSLRRSLRKTKSSRKAEGFPQCVAAKPHFKQNPETPSRSAYCPFALLQRGSLSGRVAGDLINSFHHGRTNFGRQRSAHGHAAKGGQNVRLSAQGEKLHDCQPHFDVRMIFERAHQRLDLTGFRHEKQQREGVIGLIATLARQITHGFVSES